MDWSIIKRAASKLLLCVLLSGRTSLAQEPPASEYEVEAAFLYHFAEFVTWPDAAFAAPNAPVNIGILGDDPFGPALETIIKNKTVKGHPLRVLHPVARSLSEMKRCQILFISVSESRRIPQILESLQQSSVLTVSRADRFVDLGGMVHFLIEGKKVRFEINDNRAKNAGLEISAKLLRLARTRNGS